MADSPPPPGPLINTLTSCKPYSIAFFAAVSAVVCAAKGVDFFAPLNPNEPADAHESALNILRHNLALLETISQKILEKEVIEVDELKQMLEAS